MEFPVFMTCSTRDKSLMTTAPAPSRTLIVYAHSAPHRSHINQRMIDAARELPDVTVRDLYETYPDFNIDIAREQALLSQADLVVFQHPVQWYSMPSLLKEWVDVVFEPGWAYGNGGTALQGKDFWLAVSTGSASTSYVPDGYHGYPFDAFLPPIRQTVALCGMRWLPPHILYGAHDADDATVVDHIERYRECLATYPHWTASILHKDG